MENDEQSFYIETTINPGPDAVVDDHVPVYSEDDIENMRHIKWE